MDTATSIAIVSAAAGFLLLVWGLYKWFRAPLKHRGGTTVHTSTEPQAYPGDLVTVEKQRPKIHQNRVYLPPSGDANAVEVGPGELQHAIKVKRIPTDSLF